MMKLLIVLSALQLAACSPSASFIPEKKELPDAVIYKPYFHKINIIGGRVIKMEEPVQGKLEPDDSGIFMVNCRLPERVITSKTRMLADGNCVEIKGKPVRTGIVKVTLSGGLYGNMFVSPGRFKKTYLINVMAGKE